MMNDPWTDRLSEYIDGDLGPAEAAELETHLGECLACRDVLTGLQAVARATAGLQNREPARDLWPGILDRIGEAAVQGPAPAAGPVTPAHADVLPLHRPARLRRFSFSAPQLLAASIAMMAVSGGAVWMAVRAAAAPAPYAVQAAAPDGPGTLGAEAAVLISSVEQEYRPAIDELEREFNARRDQLDPETVQVVEANLRVIDDAIAEARAALSRDPANGYLYHHLDQTMTKKVGLLRRAASANLATT